MIQAHIPTQSITNSPVVNNEFADLETPRVLFMAMDGIPEAEKYEMPFKAFGGMYLPHIAGLRESKYMLYRCKFTQLPSFTPIGDWDMMLPPEMRSNLQRSFTQTVTVNGKTQERVVMGFLESDAQHIKKEGTFKQQRSNHLLFHKRFPGHDVRKATQRSAPHGVGGVVEITALKNASIDEINAAQHFFFPDWDVIAQGDAPLPTTAKEMESYIKGRVADIPNQLWDESVKEQYKSIGRDMLRSVEEFSRNAINIVKGDEITMKVAFDAGEAQAQNSAVSDLLLAQTETRRKNDLLSGEASATTELVKEMRAERAGNAEIAKKQLEIEERKLYLAEISAGIRDRDITEEIRLGLRQANSDKVPVSMPKDNAEIQTMELDTATITNITHMEDSVSNAMSIRVCGQPTANGVCKRELKEGDVDACWQHAIAE